MDQTHSFKVDLFTCDELSNMSCSSNLDICSSSMLCDTNLVKKNKELNEEVNKLKEKLDGWYNSKKALDNILKYQRGVEDKSGVGFPTNEKEMRKKKEKKSVAKQRCFGCNEKGHKIVLCPNKKIEYCTPSRNSSKKQEKVLRRKNITCYNCREKGHIGKDCPNGNTSKPILFNDQYLLRKNKNDNIIAKVVGSNNATQRPFRCQNLS